MAERYNVLGDSYDFPGNPDDVGTDGGQSKARAAAAALEELMEAERQLAATQRRRAVASQAREQDDRAASQTARKEQASLAGYVGGMTAGHVAGALRPPARESAEDKGGAVMAAAGAAAGALAGLASAGLGAATTLFDLGKSASPAMGKAFDEATGLLKSTLGQAFAPAVVMLGAAAIVAAEHLSEAAIAVGEFIASLGEKGGGAIKKAEESDLSVSLQWLFKVGRYSNKPDDFSEGGKNTVTMRGIKDPDFGKGNKSAFQEAIGMMIRSMEVHSGQGAPKFEAVSEAFKRVQMAEAGMTDIARSQLDVQRKMLDRLREMVGMGGADDSAGEGSGGHGDWGGNW